MKRTHLGAVVGWLLLAGTACSYVSEDGKEWRIPEETEGEAVGEHTDALIQAHNKICSVLVTNRWRDTIMVNDNWTWQRCSDFGAQVGAQRYAIGCTMGEPSEFTLSVDNPIGTAPIRPPPNPNCQWL